MSQHVIAYTFAGTAFAISAVKVCQALRASSDPRSRGMRPVRLTIAVVTALGGLTAGLAAPPVVVSINRVSGVPNLAAPIVHLGIIALAASVQVLLLLWSAGSREGRPRVRWRLWTLAAVGVVLIGLFAAGDVPDERPVDFESYYALQPAVAAYSSLYLITYGVVHLGVARLCLNWSRSSHVATHPWLRRGLRTVAVSAVCAMGFSAARFLAMAARWFGLDIDALALPLSVLSAQVGLLGFLIGLLLPAYGQPLARIPGRVRAYLWELRAHLLLKPLWAALRPVNPSAVQTVARQERFSVRWRVIRQVMEIHDWLAVIRPYHSPAVARDAERLGRAAGLAGPRLEDLVLACQIRVLVATKPWSTSPIAVPEETDSIATGVTEAVYVAEVSQLTRLAAAYRSPLVDSVARPHLRPAVTGADLP